MTSSKTKQPQICIRIWGGLANQMFQYAAGFATARRLGCELLLDYIPSHADHGGYGLDLFGIATPRWQPQGQHDILTSLKLQLKKGKGAEKQRCKLWPGKRYLQKHPFTAEDFDDIKAGTYMEGYFQSERFFASCRDEIRKIFSLDHYRPTMDQEPLKLAARPDSLSLHIRRGDYTDPKNVGIHGILTTEYYERARRLMHRLNGEGPLLVFSDDMDAADKLTANWPERILVKGQSREQDLYLMSQCASHIIANSSFSWWGAWLGRNPDKTVIAPRRWFAREKLKKTYIDDLFPQGWILV